MFHVYDMESDRQLRIRFYKTWLGQGVGEPCPPRYTTVCEIQDEDANMRISIGCAHLHPNDVPNRVIGKKVALTNALIKERVESPDGKITIVWNFPRHIRTDIWESFWAWVENWKLPRRPQRKVEK